jgi:hypothetical protein
MEKLAKHFPQSSERYSGDGGEQAPHYLACFGAVMFLQSVTTPRSTEGNIGDHSFPNMSAADETAYNEGA